jgi:hypothetical protein
MKKNWCIRVFKSEQYQVYFRTYLRSVRIMLNGTCLVYNTARHNTLHTASSARNPFGSHNLGADVCMHTAYKIYHVKSTELVLWAAVVRFQYHHVVILCLTSSCSLHFLHFIHFSAGSVITRPKRWAYIPLFFQIPKDGTPLLKHVAFYIQLCFIKHKCQWI